MFEVGDEVEVIRVTPIGRGSLLSLQPGDRGIVEGVSGGFCRIRVAGYPMLARADDLILVRRPPPPSRRRRG